MKNLLALFVLAASTSMLQANCGNQGPNYPQTGPQYQGQYQQNFQGKPQYGYQQGQPQYGYQQGQPQYGYQQGQSQGDFQGYPQEQSLQGYQQGQGYQGYAQNSGPSSQNDQELTRKVQDSIHSAFSDKYNNVQVSVNNGNVSLKGTVATEEDKNDLERKIRDINGVQNVNNQVKVQEKSSSQHNNH